MDLPTGPFANMHLPVRGEPKVIEQDAPRDMFYEHCLRVSNRNKGLAEIARILREAREELERAS